MICDVLTFHILNILVPRHHPDRNNGSAESTERFKEIGDAYTILSDPSSRRDYDLSLKFPTSATDLSATATSATKRYQRYKDPFQQFDDLFRHDPFFHNAFQDMDDVFSKRFENSANASDDANGNETEESYPCPLGVLDCGGNKQEKKTTSWGEWILNKLGIELTVTSYSHDVDGSVTETNFTSKPGTSTSKRTHTYMENGRQVTIMSMEKNGNKIEDKFIGGVLIERKVNGLVEPTSQVSR
jgi:curved DNA-binding protein CbpA